MSDEPWTRDDLALATAITRRFVSVIKEVPLDLRTPIRGLIAAVGILIREDLEQRPQRLALYLAMLAALVEHVSPMPAEGSNLQH
jgi:hypothetical protein